MDTPAGINTLATTAVFVDRVRGAVVKVAVDVIKAVLDAESTTAVDKARRALGERVIEDPSTYAQQFAWVLASRPTITETITDAALITGVRDAWNYLARLAL